MTAYYDYPYTYLNDENLPFSSLFLLRHDIEKYGDIAPLSLRNQMALSIVKEVITGEKDPLSTGYSSWDYIQRIHSVLKWILETGARDDGLSNEYDGVLDSTAILLIKVYGDKAPLPLILDMIFNRYNKGLFINHLVWAFFQAKDPNSLMLIAQRLKSTNSKDIDLARKLLCFCPGVDLGNPIDGEKQYTSVVNWIRENGLFLHFTGESFQQSTKPLPYVVVLEGKYLCKTVDLHTGKIFETLTSKEWLILDEYKKLDEDTKIFLSNFSYNLHHKDPYSWKIWIHYPMIQQVTIARTRTGVRS